METTLRAARAKMMQQLAIRAGFIDDKNDGHEFNPLGPHALRESFGSIMTNSGVPDTVVDFWLGHEIGEMAEAYKGVQLESLKQMYLAREKLISISAQKVDVEEIKENSKQKWNSRINSFKSWSTVLSPKTWT